MKKTNILPVMAITLTAILWGLSFLSIKISVMVIPPMTLALLRFIIASVVLLALLKIAEPETRIRREDAPALAVAGLLGITAYFFFENNGVRLTTAAVASIIIAIIPILSILADYIVFRNSLSPFGIICVVVSILGVYLVVGANISGHNSHGNLTGNLLMLGAAVCFTAYNIVTRPLGKKYSQLAIVTYQTLFATISLIPLSLLERNSWRPVSLTVILNVIFLGIFCSALGYYLYVYALKKMGIGTVSIFINLIPVVTVASSYLILHETVGPAQMAGGALIILSVYLSSWKQLSVSRAAVSPET